MNNRIDYLDIAKGIGIILVYIGHCSIDHNGALFRAIYSFHMPLFFMISGLLYGYKRNIGIHKTILGKIISLLMPYFMFSIIYGLFYLMIGNNPIVYLWNGLVYPSTVFNRSVSFVIVGGENYIQSSSCCDFDSVIFI